MAKRLMARKPSRSDEVLEADQQLRIVAQIRSHFDSLAPKRPIKPNRSESDSTPKTPSQIEEDQSIPELVKFQSLLSQSNSNCFEEGASSLVQDEFVETQYYKELISIDKQHHTTGHGFIKVGVEGDQDEHRILRLHREANELGRSARDMMNFRSNPATNDWIPSLDGEEEVAFVSLKPSRSESC